ncbi:MAG: hypothetical protein H7Z21_01510 [Hymenobacter sp.]|nr:hypothetical protein [Hymenobacter sp.]
MRRLPPLLFLFLLLLGGQPPALAQSVWAPATIPLIFNPRHQVGDILFDPAQDRADFALRPATPIYQYYNFGTGYAGGRVELRRVLRDALCQPPAGSAGSGFLTVRFVVNYQGETDRFRVSMLDSAYQPGYFAPALVAQVLHACRQLRAWEPGRIRDVAQDSYFYITFVVREGRIQDITL